MISTKKLLAIVVVTGLCGLLAVQYLRLIQPAAAREVVAACRGLQPTPENPAIGSLPAVAPDFEVYDHNGNKVHLSDFRGKVVFLNFWASWCTVCKAEKPSMETMAKKLQDDDFVVLAIASDPDFSDVRKDFPNGSPLNILIDPPQEGENLGPVAQSYGIKAVPESFVIDKMGRIQHYFVNKRDWNSGVAQTCLRSLKDA